MNGLGMYRGVFYMRKGSKYYIVDPKFYGDEEVEFSFLVKMAGKHPAIFSFDSMIEMTEYIDGVIEKKKEESK